MNAKARKAAALGRFAALTLLALAVFPAAASAAPPTLTVDPVGTHSITTAHVSGTVTVDSAENGGQQTSWGFEYSSDGGATWSGFSFLGPVQPGEGPVAVSQGLTGLSAETPYEVRLVALNFSEFIEEPSPETQSFETDPAPNVPTLATNPPSSVSYTTGKLWATLDPEGGNTDTVAGLLPISWALQVEPQGAGSGAWATFAEGTIGGSEAESDNPIPLIGEATGLTPATTYAFRLHATYAGLPLDSSEGEFTTKAVAPPDVSTPEALEVGATVARLAGSVEVAGSDEAFTASCRFEYLTQAEWEANADAFPGAGAPSIPCQPEQVFGPGQSPVEASLTGLAPSTTYHLRAAAANAAGTVYREAVSTFQTASLVAPTVSSPAATEVTATSAHLQGTIDPGGTDPGNEATYRFQCVPACPSAEAAGALAPGELPQAVEADATGLEPGAEYEVTLVAESLGGAESASARFTTLPLPLATILVPTDVTTSSAVLHASVDTHGLGGAYRFQLVSTDSAYQESTPVTQLPATPGPLQLSVPVGGLPADRHFTAVLFLTTPAASVKSDPISFAAAAEAPLPPRPGPPVALGFACSNPSLSAQGGCVTPSSTRKASRCRRHRPRRCSSKGANKRKHHNRRYGQKGQR